MLCIKEAIKVINNSIIIDSSVKRSRRNFCTLPKIAFKVFQRLFQRVNETYSKFMIDCSLNCLLPEYIKLLFSQTNPFFGLVGRFGWQLVGS